MQTAYANGGSTRFIREQLPGVSVAVTPTGVKFLHHAAVRRHWSCCRCWQEPAMGAYWVL